MTSRTQPFHRLLEDELLGLAADTAGGRACHLVGGALRDAALGLPSPDFDLLVAGDGEDYSRRLANRLGARLVLLGGDRFSAYRVVHENLVIDVWDRGSGSLAADLQRRDLTINAMALDLETAAFHDPFDGMSDLRQRRLRAVSDSSFRGDPLRVLRLVRFAALLPSFSIGPATRRLARDSAASLIQIATERVREELSRILLSGSPVRILELMADLGARDVIWGAAGKDLDGLEGLFTAYEKVEKNIESVLGAPPDRLLTLHTLAKIFRTSRGQTQPGNERSDRTPAGTSSETRFSTRTQARAITKLARIPIDPSELEARPFLRRWGTLWVEAAAVLQTLPASVSAPLPSDWFARIAALVQNEGVDVLDPRPILDGHEVSDALGIPAGPLVGRLLELLLAAQEEGSVATREDAFRSLPGLLRKVRR